MNTPIEIGSRRELFVNDALIEAMTGGARQCLQHPVPREESLATDRPWEGNMSGAYSTVFCDGDRYRMYYQAWNGVIVEVDGKTIMREAPIRIGYAESEDGIHWRRPSLGLIAFDGSKDNNIVWEGQGDDQKGIHGFSPFKDLNPACRPEARYKAVGATTSISDRALYAMVSPDGLRWKLMSEDPILKDCAFDSQNLVFWDAVRGEYRAYMRDVLPPWYRGIKTATSKDFVCWTEPQWLEYPGAPTEQLYTNQVAPYYRAPHLFVGFPTRYVERPWSPSIEALPEPEHRRLRARVSERYGAAVTDGLFMASRDGRTFKRWAEAFIRPGLRTIGSWAYGDCYQDWGLVETASALRGAPRELSMYVSENYWRNPCAFIRRYSLRIDGFVSIHAPLAGGELLTRPLTFAGDKLELNISTSAAGSAAVELQDAGGRPLPGFSLGDCHEVVGDSLDYIVRWKNGHDLTPWQGRPIRLRFSLRDADLYSFRFPATVSAQSLRNGEAGRPAAL